MQVLRRSLAALLLLLAALPFGTACADALRDRVDALAEGSFDDKQKAVEALSATGDDRAVAVLEAMQQGDLVALPDGRVLISRSAGEQLIDPLGGDAVEASGRLEKVRVNNRLRRAIRSAVGGLTLLNPQPAVRRAAADVIFKSRDESVLDTLETALARETDAGTRHALAQAHAAVIVALDRPTEERLQAVATIAERGNREALSLLIPLQEDADEEVARAAREAVGGVRDVLALWEAGQNVYYGLSLGSVLLLAAIGLAITFGVMGVINMAHGEMVMLGAYTTFLVQEVIRSSAPALFDYSLLAALPLAFLVSGAVGIAIERGIIRFLYGRPLETLLATWGLSLILQQAVRTLFGPTNQEVGNPSWMSGAFQIGGLTITYNRLWIIVFSIAVLGLLTLVLKRTPAGLQMRAVTQNRAMAGAMGIRTQWVDAFTFGLGSGIAGIAGVALSQIDNVSPNLGQSYIIDSFMVVVFGGVGNLWGTLVGAMSLGVLNKFLEPYAGAVLAKILVLVVIILFIQRRPRGLFALKGRAVES